MDQEPQPAIAGALSRWAATCDGLGATTKKLEKRAILASYLAGLPIADAARAAQYIAGEPFSEVDRRRLSVGGSLLTRAVAERSGADAHAIGLAFRRHGDVGAAGQELIVSGPKREPLGLVPELSELEGVLGEIAAARGPAAKLRILSAFLARCTALECRYVLKLISGDMRIGVKASLVEEAIAAAYGQQIAAVRHAGMLLGSLPQVVERAAAGTLGEARMRLFHPLGFMLASPVDSVGEAIARFAEEVAAEQTGQETGQGTGTAGAGERLSDHLITDQLLTEAQIEDKYDGMRAQLHAGDPTEPGRVGLFSRNREDLSHAFPELMEAFTALREPAILDGEILAWSPAFSSAACRHHTSNAARERQQASTGNEVAEEGGGRTLSPVAADTLAKGRALPFSSLQQRLGRKQVSAELRRMLPVVFMAFDILYADGHLLLDESLRSRRARLEQYIAAHEAASDGRGAAEEQGKLFTGDDDEAGPFPRLLLAPAFPLASAAQLDAAYGEARRRGNEGVMLKASGSSYQPGRRGLAWLKLKRELATLDVVVTGAEFGSGRRAGYLSDYTFAVRGPSGELLNVGKAYSGVTDGEMAALSEHFHLTVKEDFGHYRTVLPDTVFEVAFNNITRSARHASGFALRFPRILRIRTDKPVDEIDTLARVEELYNAQPDKPVEAG